MKTNSVTVDTRKTLKEIIQILNSFKCSIQRLNPDPFGEDKADIEVVLAGQASFADTVKNVGAGKSNWAVQVYVYDMGKYRHCELVALGESGWTSGLGRSMTDIAINGLDYVNMRHSKTYREKIIRKLEPIDTEAEKRKADANRSILYMALRNLPEMSNDELFRRQCIAMAPLTERFLKNHPDFSESEILAAECAGMYRVGGNNAKSDEILTTMKVSEGKDNRDLMNAASAELHQIMEDDALSGNDRSALYLLAFYTAMFESQGDKAVYFVNNLLNRVLRLENSGKNVTEDLKIWPLLAKDMRFEDWHEYKYGENGTSGKFDASDPALAKRAASERTVPAEPEPEVKKPAAAPKHEPKHAAKPAPAPAKSAAEAPKKPVITDSGDTVTVSKKTLIIAGVILAALILLLAVKALAPKNSEGSPAAETAAENTEQNSEVVEGRSDVTILSSDWDWDSSRKDGSYVVDAIMFVRNDTGGPITGIDFVAYSKEGDFINNAGDPGAVFSAFGYVEDGASGIMVGEIRTDQETVRPDDGAYKITGVYTNDTIEDDYIVPQGYVVRNYGEDNNYYDVTIDNQNDADVGDDAILVMVKIEGNKIKDSDATGRLTDSIEGNTFGFVQEEAFYDPHMYTKYNELTVFAIDKSYLQNKH